MEQKLRTVKIYEDLAYEVKKYAAANRLKMQDIIQAAIREYLDKLAAKPELK